MTRCAPAHRQKHDSYVQKWMAKKSKCSRTNGNNKCSIIDLKHSKLIGVLHLHGWEMPFFGIILHFFEVEWRYYSIDFIQLIFPRPKCWRETYWNHKLYLRSCDLLTCYCKDDYLTCKLMWNNILYFVWNNN
jgi:hypothetical protein